MDTFLIALSRGMRYPMDGVPASLQLAVSVQRGVQINNGARRDLWIGRFSYHCKRMRHKSCI